MSRCNPDNDVSVLRMALEPLRQVVERRMLPTLLPVMDHHTALHPLLVKPRAVCSQSLLQLHPCKGPSRRSFPPFHVPTYTDLPLRWESRLLL